MQDKKIVFGLSVIVIFLALILVAQNLTGFITATKVREESKTAVREEALVGIAKLPVRPIITDDVVKQDIYREKVIGVDLIGYTKAFNGNLLTAPLKAKWLDKEYRVSLIRKADFKAKLVNDAKKGIVVVYTLGYLRGIQPVVGSGYEIILYNDIVYTMTEPVKTATVAINVIEYSLDKNGVLSCQSLNDNCKYLL